MWVAEYRRVNRASRVTPALTGRTEPMDATAETEQTDETALVARRDRQARRSG